MTSEVRHPARFSDRILDVVAKHVEGSAVLLDPFAGTGRVHELRSVPGVVRTIGVEIEPEWAALHPDTLVGDALDLAACGVGPASVDHVVTSPTYGNRMADHHDARDGSVRNTYKHTLGRDLSPNSSGQLQWGAAYRDFHELAWCEALTALRSGGRFTLNLKNHVRRGVVQRVVEWHVDVLMHGFGLRLDALDAVPTAGLAHGENSGVRTGFEVVVTFRKP